LGAVFRSLRRGKRATLKRRNEKEAIRIVGGAKQPYIHRRELLRIGESHTIAQLLGESEGKEEFSAYSSQVKKGVSDTGK